jgi:acyl-CoA synthetase (AMP-forming)/AMP-acid ligase II
MTGQWFDMFVPLPRIWQQNAARFGAKPALVTETGVLSWAELGARMERIAGGLRAAGLAPGDRVALLTHGGTTAIETLMGVWCAELVAVPLSPLLTPEQADVAARDAGAIAAVATAPFTSHARALSISGPCFADGFVADGWRDYAALRDAAPLSEGGWPGPDEPAIIIYSSGTTGIPKGIVHTFGARMMFAVIFAIALQIGPESRILLTTPIASNATAIMLLPALLTGATTVVLPKFDADAITRALAEEGITHAFSVPAAIEALIARPAPIAAPTLRCLLSAGSHLRPDVKRNAVAAFGPVVHELYGCTEGLATMLFPDELLDHAHSVGRAVLGGEITILGPDDRPLPPGEAGEVVGRFGAIMLGYHGRPEATAEAVWVDLDGRRWARSGDIGRLDHQGYLTILDRKKDMILSGGYNVYPADIEAVLLSHPAVRECAVVGAPHERWGETPYAFLVGDPDPAEVIAFANQRLAKHQRLAGARTIDALPRNVLGKVLKRELRLILDHGERSA